MLSRVMWTIGFAVALTGCRPAPSPVPGPVSSADARPLADRVPTETGTYRQVERRELPDDGGTLFRFRDASSVHLTVILYPVESAARSAPRDATAILRQEGDKWASIMETQVRRGVYTSYRLMASRPDTVATAPGLMPGHTGTAAVLFRGRPVVEYQRLFLIDTTFVKMRATVPETSWPRRDIDSAIAAIVASLIRP